MFVPVPPGRDEDRSSAPADGTLAIDPRTEQELRAFVRRNADFYLRAWAPALTGSGRITRVNIAAFFFPAFWLGYRKMYAIFCILAFVVIAEYLAEFFIFVAILGLDEPPWATSIVFGLIAAVICGVCGNQWYLSYARRAMARVRAKGLDEAAYLRELSRIGGTSILAPLLLLLSFCISFSVVMLLLMLIFGTA